MFGFKPLGNTKVKHHKNTASMPAIPMTPPTTVLLPMAQHIGAPATPIVKVGDTVRVGQKIAEATGYVSSPIYATVSGTVAKLEDYLRPNGTTVQAIRINSDGNMTLADDITPPVVNDLASLIEACKNSGIVGLGGAGFPTAVKLDGVGKGDIDTVILNGAECEPYLTGDTRTMLDDSKWIYEGVKLFKTYCPSIKKFIIGIEENKPECIEEMARIFADEPMVTIMPLPPKYPQGAEKVLIYNTTGRVVPEGKLPSDVCCMVINVTSLALYAKYVHTGMPLVSRVVTVDGSAIASPKNVIVPIGTSVGDVISFVRGEDEGEKIGKVLFGGPMMGIPAESMNDPITKTTGGLTVLNERDARSIEPTACIHCGRCVISCPHLLNPTTFAKALKIENKEERMAVLTENKVNLCIDCGCCSYVCPAHRPLVQNNIIAKAELRAYNAERANKK